MSFISSVVPMAAAPAIPVQTQNTRVESSQSAQVLTQAGNINAPAADSKARTASSGQNKQVDSTFDSEKYRSNKESKNSSGGKSTINIVA